MFAGWESFYNLIGEAAATLIGLLFVIVTLGAAQGASSRKAAHLFLTPTLVHFAAVFSIALLVLVPGSYRIAALFCLLLVGLAGSVYVAAISGRVLKSELLDPSDFSARMFYVPLPALGYLLIIAGSVAALAGWSKFDPALAVAAVILLAVGIRNAWAMALFAVGASTKAGKD